jgi:putative transposase
MSNTSRIISKQNVRGLALDNLDKLEDRFTNICYFALRPNHFHITLQQEKDEGVQDFMHKLGTSYTMYFNKKHSRDGVLFQGPFQAIPIESDSYLMQISQYIHLNPLKDIEPEFREKGVRDFDGAKNFLSNYKWSSYLDYIGIKNMPFLLNNPLHEGYFKNPFEYEKFVLSGIKLFEA